MVEKVFLQSLPHFALAFASLSYIFLTAVIFQQLDETHHSNVTANFSMESELKRTQLDFIEQLRSLKHEKDLSQYMSAGQQLFDSLVEKVQRIKERRKIHTSQGRGLGKFIMFSATTLTSIGYGNDSPRSTDGRLFCILVCLIGIPLIIITVADLAKFLSHSVLEVYLKWRHFSHRLWLRRLKPHWDRLLRRRSSASSSSSHSKALSGASDTIDLRILSDEEVADFLWTFLETAEFVEVPTLWALALVLLYAACGAAFLQLSEGWSYFESFYCATLSILTVGFGDLAPTNPNWVAIAVLYVSFGSVITTMCIDAVAYRYIRQVHNVQRRIKLNDDIEWLKAVQNARMRKDALKALFTALAFLPTRDLNHFASSTIEKALEEPKKKPNSPKNLQVEYVNAYSIALHWSYDDPIDDVQFSLAYKPKHLRTASPTVIDNIKSLMIEVAELKSFTLYEFMLTATNSRDRSESIHVLQYTEPETVPQNLKIELLEEPGSIRLTWDPPCKNKVDERAYHVYYTDASDLPFEKWNRLPLRTSCQAIIDSLNLSRPHHFCVSALHNSGVAVLSRVVTFSPELQRRL